MTLSPARSRFKVKVVFAKKGEKGFNQEFEKKYFPRKGDKDVWALNIVKMVRGKPVTTQLQFKNISRFEQELNSPQNGGEGITSPEFVYQAGAFAPLNKTTAWSITQVTPVAPSKPYKIYRLKGKSEP